MNSPDVTSLDAREGIAVFLCAAGPGKMEAQEMESRVECSQAWETRDQGSGSDSGPEVFCMLGESWWALWVILNPAFRPSISKGTGTRAGSSKFSIIYHTFAKYAPYARYQPGC